MAYLIRMTTPLFRPPYPVLLYDGVCSFCNSTVKFVLKHDHRGSMRFAALQSGYAYDLLQSRPDLRNIDTVVLYEPGEENSEGRFFTRSKAALRIVSYLGGLWSLCAVLYVVPRPIRDYLYDTFARYRYRWFGKYDTCPIPSPEVRSRFLDQQPV